MFLNSGMAQKENYEYERPAKSNTDGAKAADDKKDFSAMICAIAENQDRQAFIALFEHFAPRVKSFLMKAGSDEPSADELAQETMLTVWNKAGSFNPEKAAASTWIFTIARNKRIDLLRKTTRYELEYTDPLYVPDESASPVENINHEQEAVRLKNAIENLPEEQASLIKKAFFEDKSHTAIAEETGIALGTVKSRIRLALERLRKNAKVNELWN